MEDLTKTLKFVPEEGFILFQCDATDFSESNCSPVCLQYRTYLSVVLLPSSALSQGAVAARP